MKDISDSLPQVLRSHIEAQNTPNLEAFAATFASDALLNDARREFVGVEAIKAWAAREIFGDNVRVQLESAYEHGGIYILRLIYDGDFDKAGLPDPLVLTNYITLRDDRIAHLFVTLNQVSYPDQPMPGIR